MNAGWGVYSTMQQCSNPPSQVGDWGERPPAVGVPIDPSTYLAPGEPVPAMCTAEMASFIKQRAGDNKNLCPHLQSVAR
eukprot:320552-Chlamydomonas_euryale.AAC.33